jgi:polyisoprenoid-binding protein YceI
MVEFSRTARRASTLLVAAAMLAQVVIASPAAPVQYTLDASRSLLRFSFTQAGASNTGRFGKLTVNMPFSADNLAASKLDVTVDVRTLDTGDKERDDTLRGGDLFDVARYPQAQFTATRLTAVGTSRYEAVGKLTIRGVTRDLKLPFVFQTKQEEGRSVGYMSGQLTLRRLDFGVGQGEWKSTEWVGNDVPVNFSLRLVPAG